MSLQLSTFKTPYGNNKARNELLTGPKSAIFGVLSILVKEFKAIKTLRVTTFNS